MSAYPFLHEENSGLKITFYQQSMNETEKAYKENRTVSSRNLPETSALSGGSRVTIGQGNEGIPGSQTGAFGSKHKYSQNTSQRNSIYKKTAATAEKNNS